MAKQLHGVTLAGKGNFAYAQVLTTEAISFVATIHRQFEKQRQQLLVLRAERQKSFDKGDLPDFLPETSSIRAAEWQIAPVPKDLLDRRVEICGPTDRRSVVEALNSGAMVFIADFEDSNSPTWDNMLQGHMNLIDRWSGKIDYTDAGTGKRHGLGRKPAVLMVKPRGLHLTEERMQIDGAPVAGALLDFCLFVFHNAKPSLAAGSGPYLVLSKLESHLEARFWNQVFIVAQSLLALPLGTLKATALIETVPAAFEMDEIIFELRDHLAGLAYGARNHIFSFAKTFAGQKKFILPDHFQIAKSKSFPDACSALVVKTCHRRGAFALGASSTLISNSVNPKPGGRELADFKAEKEIEARCGQDGTCVIDATLAPIALKYFSNLVPTSNQLYVKRDEVQVGQKSLLEIPKGRKTEAGFRESIRIGIVYIEAWLRGIGSVPLNNQIVDMASAEIARSQVWQWLTWGIKLDDGPKLTRAIFDKCLAEEVGKIKSEVGHETFSIGRFKEAVDIFKATVTSKNFEPFMTVRAYRKLL